MQALKEYDIEFIKLKPGEHSFSYMLDASFFKHYEQSSLKDGSVTVDLLFDKGNTMFDLRFTMRGTVEVECDRCLDMFNLPVSGSFNLMVKITEQELEDEDDLVYIHPNDYKLNVAQYLYDMVQLALPIKKTCDMVGKACNPVVMEKITGSIDVSTDDSEEPGQDDTNPEWEKQLKNIFKN